MKIALFSAASISMVLFRLRFIESLVAAGHTVSVISPEDEPGHAETIRRAGAYFIPFSLNRTGANPFAEVSVLVRLRKLWREVYFDHLICYAHKPVLYGLFTAPRAGRRIWAMLPGLGFVYTGNTLKHRLARVAFRFAYRVLLRRASALFLLNSDDAQTLREANVTSDTDRIEILRGEGVPLDEFPAWPMEADPFRFLIITRLLRDKGITEYLEAAVRIKALHPNVECHVVGPMDTHPTAVSRRVLDELQQQGLIIYHGAQKDVRPFLRSCSVYVLPSYREGTPRTVLEAMATGRTIITTDVPGCRETIFAPGRAGPHGERQGLNGFLVPARDVNGLLAAMEQCLSDGRTVQFMALASRRLAEEHYDIRQVNRRILDCLGLSRS